MTYCIECGTLLEEKYLKDEGMIPFCPHCQEYRFSLYSVAISTIIFNKDYSQILLIKQYHRDDFVLVAGYINKGESAEETLKREVKEETGLNVVDMHFNQSSFFEKSQTLMLNFACVVDDQEFQLKKDEVDDAKWFSIEDAKKNIKHCSLAQSFLNHYLQEKIL